MTPEAERPVALITGAGSGIGRATALLLARRGWDLVLVGRRRTPLEETASLAEGATSEIVTGDVVDMATVEAMVAAADRRFGRLDALVNNAGYAPPAPLGEIDDKTVRDVMNINAVAPVLAVARAWPMFRRQGRGCVVNVSSVASADPYPGLGVYGCAKAATNLLAKACMNEGEEFGLRAFAVAPGAVETEMLRAIFPESLLPRSAALAPERVAEVIVGCIAGERDGENGGTIFVPSP